jgi:hypothetical protein
MKTQKSRSEIRLNPFGAALNLVRTLFPTPSEVRKRLEGMIRARDVASLAGVGKVEDREYSDPEIVSVLAERQVAALFKKNEQFSDDNTCSTAARKTFERGEKLCRITNRRLDWYGLHPERLKPELRAQLEKMQGDIASLLGKRSDLEDAMPSRIRLTNGATEDRSRRRSLPFLKITGTLKGPRAMIPALGRLLLHYGVDLTSCKFTCVERNVITLVPKNWLTHRTIAKEPTHSLPFQLVLDNWLKSKLRKWGIDLSSQTKNQEFARVGSIDGSIATIDLEMASDTLSFNAVVLLLPFPWFELLNSFRSSSFSAPWGTGVYAKFSSMGNGYTFTLETLIFAAACRAVGSRQYAVYGDDIALESHLVPKLVELLNFLGFKVNDAKSFYNPQSRFRESCGCDYYKGQLVTPFYLRECPRESDKAGMSHNLNGLVGAAMVPGPLWDWVAKEVSRLGLYLVPWNEDSRSGVWITPRFAWETKRLKINRHTPKVPKPERVTVLGTEVNRWKTEIDPTVGFPVFKSYTPSQDSRKTAGWRSLFLWFIEKNYGGDRVDPLVPKRHAAFLQQLVGKAPSDLIGSTATVKSEVITRTRYVHGTSVFSPKTAMTPSHLYLFDEVVGKQKSRNRAI